MRIPKRKPGKYAHQERDPHLTQEKVDEMKAKLEGLKSVSRPRAIAEVKRLAEMGDFSENAAYQMAKGRLRGINQRILELDDHLKRAVIIRPNHSGVVQLGSTVTVEISGQQKTFLILGSAETDPGAGVISHKSPIGAALMGHGVGETVSIRLASRKLIECRVLAVAN